MDESQNQIKVGIGVLILKDGKVLLGERKGSHGAGEFAFPGGKLEYGESFEACAQRETTEECGIEIQNIRFLLLSNLRSYPPTHWVHVGIVADWKSGEPVVLEPNKCVSWGWYDVDALPSPLFATVASMIDSYKTGTVYVPES